VLRHPWRLLGGAGASLLASFLFYCSASQRAVILLRAASDICSAHPVAVDGPILEGSFFPLSNRCHWKDGSSTQLVSPLVNPILFLLLGLTLALVVLWIRALIEKILSPRRGVEQPSAGRR